MMQDSVWCWLHMSWNNARSALRARLGQGPETPGLTSQGEQGSADEPDFAELQLAAALVPEVRGGHLCRRLVAVLGFRVCSTRVGTHHGPFVLLGLACMQTIRV